MLDGAEAVMVAFSNSPWILFPVVSVLLERVTPEAVPPVIATLLAFWVDIVPRVLDTADTAVPTKAVVAIWVVFVPAVAVGAVGVPDIEGEAISGEERYAAC